MMMPDDHGDHVTPDADCPECNEEAFDAAQDLAFERYRDQRIEQEALDALEGMRSHGVGIYVLGEGRIIG